MQNDLEVWGLRTLSQQERTSIVQKVHILFDNPQIVVDKKKKSTTKSIKEDEIGDAFDVFKQKYTSYQNVVASIARNIAEMLGQVDLDSLRHY